jgi:hypothetical protein
MVFWNLWEQGHIKSCPDEKKRKIKFRLLIPYHQLSGNMNLREVPCSPATTLDGLEKVSVLKVTFGGMWRWRRVAVARVFALVVRCRVMRLLLYSRVGKNRDTRRESPAGAGAACTAIKVFFSQKILAVQKPMTYTDLLACFTRKLRSCETINNRLGHIDQIVS